MTVCGEFCALEQIHLFLLYKISFKQGQWDPKKLICSYQLVVVTLHKLLFNRLTRIPITPIWQGINNSWDDVLSNVGAEDMDTSGYQASRPEGIDF